MLFHKDDPNSEQEAIERLRRNGIEVKIEKRKFGSTEVVAKKIYLPMSKLISGHSAVSSVGLKLWGVIDFLTHNKGFWILPAG